MNYEDPRYELNCAIGDKDIDRIEQIILTEKELLNVPCFGDDQTLLGHACIRSC
jgi:hypothetical protein